MTRTVTDVTTAAGALSSPWWLDLINHGYSGTMAVLGLLIAAGRAAIVIREWRQGVSKP